MNEKKDEDPRLETQLEKNLELKSYKKKTDEPGELPVKEIENAYDITDLTDIIGGRGWWQIRILILKMINYMPTAWNHLGLSFLAYPVDYWCKRPSANITVDQWLTEFVPNTTLRGKNHHSQCEMFLFNSTTQRPDMTSTVACESYEYSKEFNSIIQEWNLVCSRDWLISTNQTVYMIGFLITAIIAGPIADNYGRLKTLILCYIISIISGISAAFSTSILMFTICRFFVAMGQGAAGLVGYVLVVEALDSDSRVRYMCLNEFGWIVGCLLLPLFAWLIPNWFYLQLVFTLPSVFMLSYYWLLPESPRWLLANGYLTKALPILKEAIRMNGKDDTDLEAKAKILINLHAEENKKRQTISVLDLLRTPNLRRKTFCLYFLWMVIAFTYYAISMSTNDLEGNDYINFFLSSVMEILAALLCMATLDRFGRKKPFYISLLFCGLAIASCIFIPVGSPVLLTVFVMIGKLSITTAFNTVFIFSSEIFPTVARNIGVGSCSSMGRVGSALAPFMRDLGKATSPSVPLAIFAALSIISATIVFMMPETHKKPMPESLCEAEKFGKKAASKHEGLNGVDDCQK